MAWTVPRTWVAGETTSATIFNQHVRDNLLFLHDNRVSTLAGLVPVDQDEIVYVADASARTLWRLKYYASGAAGRQWEFVGGTPLAAQVDAGEVVPANAAWGDFTTIPSLTAPLAGDYTSRFGSRRWDYAGSHVTFVAPKYGAGAVSDTDAAASGMTAGGSVGMTGEHSVRTLAAADQVKLQYRQSVATAAETAYGKYLRLQPVKVG